VYNIEKERERKTKRKTSPNKIKKIKDRKD